MGLAIEMFGVNVTKKYTPPLRANAQSGGVLYFKLNKRLTISVLQ